MACNDVPYRHQDLDPRQRSMVELPRLNMAAQRERAGQSSPRRDSMGSSTGDSGYISDPDLQVEGDILLSPLEFAELEHQLYPHHNRRSEALFPPSETQKSASTKAAGKAPAFTNTLPFSKWQKSSRKSLPTPKIKVTSYPTSNPIYKSPTSPKNIGTYKDWPPLPAYLTETLSRQEDVEQWVEENNPQPHQKERKCSIVSLSSSGSCEMYSSNNNSDDEDHEPASSSVTTAQGSKLSKAIVTTIELILRKIELKLNYAAYIQCVEGPNVQQHASNNANGNQSRGNTGRNNSTSQPNTSSTNKRKSRLPEDLLPLPSSNNPEDDEDENSNKRRRVSVTTTTTDSDSGPRFACPFFKHDPSRYRNRRTCPGPGWPTVHRMKEHLYRAHAQPIFCPRCYAMFDSTAEFTSHLRSRPCPVSDPVPIEGIDRETLKELHKRSPAGKLEEEKWRDAYLLLFPEVDLVDVPSPYYTTASPSEDSIRFRRILLERVRAELYATAERDPSSPVEQRLLRQVAAIIQRCEAEILETFQPTSSMSSLASNSAPQAPVGTSSSSRRTSHSATTGTAADVSTTTPSGPPTVVARAQRGVMTQPASTSTHPHPLTHLSNPQHPSTTTPLSPRTFLQPQPQPQSFNPHISIPPDVSMHDTHRHDPFASPSHHPGAAGGEQGGGDTGAHFDNPGTSSGNFDFTSDWIDWNHCFPPGGEGFDASLDASMQHFQGSGELGLAEV